MIYSNFRPISQPNIEMLSLSAKCSIQWKADDYDLRVCPLIRYLNAACQLLQYWATIIESFNNTIYSNFRPNRLPNIEILSSSAKGSIQWKAANSSRTALVGWNPNFDVVSGLIVGCSWIKNARSILYGRPDADKVLQNDDVAGNKLKSKAKRLCKLLAPLPTH